MPDEPMEIRSFSGDELADKLDSGDIPEVDTSDRCEMCNRDRELSTYEHPMDHPQIPDEVQLCEECEEYLDTWDKELDEVCDVCRPHPQEATHRSEMMSELESNFDEDERAEMLCEGHSRFFPDSEPLE